MLKSKKEEMDKGRNKKKEVSTTTKPYTKLDGTVSGEVKQTTVKSSRKPVVPIGRRKSISVSNTSTETPNGVTNERVKTINMKNGSKVVKTKTKYKSDSMNQRSKSVEKYNRLGDVKERKSVATGVNIIDGKKVRGKRFVTKR